MEAQHTWQFGTGDSNVLFVLETTKSSTGEALNKGETVKCEDALIGDNQAVC